MRVLLTAMIVAVLFSTGAHAARVLEPADIFRMQWANDPQIRKDGSQIAYVRTANNIMSDQQTQSVWLIDTTTGLQTPVATGAGSHFSPRWSPDGSRIAFLSTGTDGRTQIAIHWIKGETAVVTNLLEAPTDITWSPDGSQIAFVMLTPVPPPKIGAPLTKPVGAQWGAEPIAINAMNYKADGRGMERHGFRHIYVISADGHGSPRQLTNGLFADGGPLAWSADGKEVYFASNRDPRWQREPADWARHTSMNVAIHRVSVADGTLTRLSQEVGPYHSPVVSPDGRQIAYLGHRDRRIGNQNMRVNVMDVDGGSAHVVGEAFDRSISNVQWAEIGRGFYVQYVDEGVTKVAHMSLSGRLDPLVAGLAGQAAATQLPYSDGEFTASAGGVIAYTGGGAEFLPEVFISQAGKVRRLTHLNADLFSEVTVGKLMPLPVRSSADGRAISAWEILPPDFDASKKYPLIIEIHGGPYASYSPVFSMDLQLYAAAGYIVVFGNPRGSTSYGEDFANTIHNNYPSHDYDDLMSMVDAAVRNGHVDESNLFITGSSGGGVLTSWSIGKTSRFKAAVVQRPVINWTSWLLMSDISAFGAHYWFKQLPWEDQETYWKHSPLSLIGNVTTPTMVLVGLEDLRTTVGEAEQYYEALQLRGVPTLLYEIPGSSHVLMHPSQLAAQSNAILEWFGRYRSAPTADPH